MKKLTKEAVVFALFFTIVMVLMKVFIGGETIWSVFYQRHAGLTYTHGTTDYFDGLSYLGRNFTFPPAYFEFVSLISYLLGINPEILVFYLHIILILLFNLSVYMLFSRFKNFRQRLLGALIFISESFVFITTVSSPLHVFSYLLLNVSVITAPFQQKINSHIFKNPMLWVCILTLLISIGSHPTSLFLFPVFACAVNGFNKEIFKKSIIFLFFAGLFSLIFFVPIIIQNGLPYEIVPKQWGYLITYGWDGALFDFQFLVPLILITTLFSLSQKNYRILGIFLLAIFLIYIGLSYRLNIIVNIILATLLVSLFEDRLKNNLTFFLFLLFPIACIIFHPLTYSGPTNWCEWGALNENCIRPMQFIEQYTTPNDNVVINPMLGHLEAYYGKRKVLADLYVEYADEQKFRDENKFYYNLTTEQLEKYNITIFVLDDMYKERDLPDFDKIYDNGFYHIYKKPYYFKNPKNI